MFPHTTSILGSQQYKDILSGKHEKVCTLGAADLWENVLRPVSVCKKQSNPMKETEYYLMLLLSKLLVRHKMKIIASFTHPHVFPSKYK